MFEPDMSDGIAAALAALFTAIGLGLYCGWLVVCSLTF
jgi:hypothetical protein